MRFVPLPIERYAGYALEYEYDTAAFFDVSVARAGEGFSVAFDLKPMPRVHITYSGALYAPGLNDPRAFALQTDGGAPAAVLEVAREDDGRMRVTNLLVLDAFRRRGYGALLLCRARALARGLSCRALTLETRACNVGAIRFCLTQGLTLTGFSACAGGGSDERGARVEMGLLLPRGKETPSDRALGEAGG